MFSKNRSDVTHILTELSFKEEVLKTQDLKDLKTWKGHILQAQWLVERVKRGSGASAAIFPGAWKWVGNRTGHHNLDQHPAEIGGW